LRENVVRNDVLYPFSSVFLAALPEAGQAHGLPRAQVQSLLAALDRVDYPAGDLYVAVPTGTTKAGAVPGGHDFGSWLIVRVDGPFADRAAVLRAAERSLSLTQAQLEPPVPAALAGWFELNRSVICESLAQLGSRCGTE
jgi:hypothetical protein